MSDSDFDIYADLLPADEENELDFQFSDQRLEEPNKDTIEKLRQELSRQNEEILSLRQTNKQLLFNMSSLYLTSKCEIERKTKLIDELRKEKDNIIFRRNQKKSIEESKPKLLNNCEVIVKDDTRVTFKKDETNCDVPRTRDGSKERHREKGEPRNRSSDGSKDEINKHTYRDFKEGADRKAYNREDRMNDHESNYSDPLKRHRRSPHIVRSTSPPRSMRHRDHGRYDRSKDHIGYRSKPLEEVKSRRRGSSPRQSSPTRRKSHREYRRNDRSDNSTKYSIRPEEKLPDERSDIRSLKIPSDTCNGDVPRTISRDLQDHKDEKYVNGAHLDLKRRHRAVHETEHRKHASDLNQRSKTLKTTQTDLEGESHSRYKDVKNHTSSGRKSDTIKGGEQKNEKIEKGSTGQLDKSKEDSGTMYVGKYNRKLSALFAERFEGTKNSNAISKDLEKSEKPLPTPSSSSGNSIPVIKTQKKITPLRKMQTSSKISIPPVSTIYSKPKSAVFMTTTSVHTPQSTVSLTQELPKNKMVIEATSHLERSTSPHEVNISKGLDISTIVVSKSTSSRVAVTSEIAKSISTTSTSLQISKAAEVTVTSVVTNPIVKDATRNVTPPSSAIRREDVVIPPQKVVSEPKVISPVAKETHVVTPPTIRGASKSKIFGSEAGKDVSPPTVKTTSTTKVISPAALTCVTFLPKVNVLHEKGNLTDETSSCENSPSTPLSKNASGLKVSPSFMKVSPSLSKVFSPSYTRVSSTPPAIGSPNTATTSIFSPIVTPTPLNTSKVPSVSPTPVNTSLSPILTPTNALPISPVTLTSVNISVSPSLITQSSQTDKISSPKVHVSSQKICKSRTIPLCKAPTSLSNTFVSISPPSLHPENQPIQKANNRSIAPAVLQKRKYKSPKCEDTPEKKKHVPCKKARGGNIPNGDNDNAVNCPIDNAQFLQPTIIPPSDFTPLKLFNGETLDTFPFKMNCSFISPLPDTPRHFNNTEETNSESSVKKIVKTCPRVGNIDAMLEQVGKEGYTFKGILNKLSCQENGEKNKAECVKVKRKYVRKIQKDVSLNPKMVTNIGKSKPEKKIQETKFKLTKSPEKHSEKEVGKLDKNLQVITQEKNGNYVKTKNSTEVENLMQVEDFKMEVRETDLITHKTNELKKDEESKENTENSTEVKNLTEIKENEVRENSLPIKKEEEISLTGEKTDQSLIKEYSGKDDGVNLEVVCKGNENKNNEFSRRKNEDGLFIGKSARKKIIFFPKNSKEKFSRGSL